MELNKYKLHKEEPDHYVMQHPDGSHFKVAKSALSEEGHEKLKQYFGGGLVESEGYAKGGKIDPDKLDPEYSREREEANISGALGNPQPPPPEGLMRLPSGNYFDPKTHTVTSKEAIGYADGGEVEESESEEEAPQETSSAAPAPATPVPGQQPPSEKQLAEPMSPDVYKAYKAAIEKERGARKAQTEAAITGAEAQTPILGDLGTSMQALQNHLNDREIERRAKNSELNRQIVQGITPDIFANKSTGDQIATAVNLAASGFAGPQVVQAVINRDIDAQKTNVEAANTAYANNLRESQNDQAATLGAQRDLLAVAKAKLAQAAAKNVRPEQQAAFQLIDSQLDRQDAQLQQQLSLFQTRQFIANNPHPVEWSMISPNPASEVYLPDGKTAVQAASPQSAEKARGVIADHQATLDAIKNLRQVSAGVNPAAPLSEKYLRTKVALANLQNQLRQQMGLRRQNPELAKQLEIMTGDPTKFIERLAEGDIRLDQLYNSVYSSMGSKLQPHGAGFRILNKARIPFTAGPK